MKKQNKSIAKGAAMQAAAVDSIDEQLAVYKSRAYDLIRLQEQAGQALREVNGQIAQLEQLKRGQLPPPPANPKPTPEAKPEKPAEKPKRQLVDPHCILQ